MRNSPKSKAKASTNKKDADYKSAMSKSAAVYDAFYERVMSAEPSADRERVKAGLDAWYVGRISDARARWRQNYPIAPLRVATAH